LQTFACRCDPVIDVFDTFFGAFEIDLIGHRRYPRENLMPYAGLCFYKNFTL
jgi:hypothetical protein